VNSGLIEGTFVALSFDPGGTHTVINSGTIRVVANNSAINANNGVEKITNRGLIAGDVHLGAGDDTFTNFQKVGTKIIAGKVQGAIDLGDGNDTFNGGAGAELVTDGNGSDIYKLGASNDVYIATGNTGTDGTDTIDGVTCPHLFGPLIT
jgi:hypothetical protein